MGTRGGSGDTGGGGSGDTGGGGEVGTRDTVSGKLRTR